MGTKRTWKWKYVFLYIACCVILIIGNTGCALFQPVMGWNDLEEAERFLALENYVLAMEMNKRAASSAYSFQMDDILYQRGLILVHPRNPQRDDKQAKESFLKLVEKYPESSLREEADIWIAIINEIENKNKYVTTIQLETSPTRKELEEKKQELQNELKETKQQLDKTQDKLKEKDQELVSLQDQLQLLNAELKELRGQIEKLKEIDLGIDTIKREALPK